MTGILIYLIIVVVLAIAVIWFYEYQITKLYSRNASTTFGHGLLIGTLLTIMLVPGVMELVLEKHPIPSAIDVYRGKTDLEIQYTIKNNDTISCDTTVVFK
jgi:hypothetical protein